VVEIGPISSNHFIFHKRARTSQKGEIGAVAWYLGKHAIQTESSPLTGTHAPTFELSISKMAPTHQRSHSAPPLLWMGRGVYPVRTASDAPTPTPTSSKEYEFEMLLAFEARASEADDIADEPRGRSLPPRLFQAPKHSIFGDYSSNVRIKAAIHKQWPGFRPDIAIRFLPVNHSPWPYLKIGTRATDGGHEDMLLGVRVDDKGYTPEVVFVQEGSIRSKILAENIRRRQKTGFVFVSTFWDLLQRVAVDARQWNEDTMLFMSTVMIQKSLNPPLRNIDVEHTKSNIRFAKMMQYLTAPGRPRIILKYKSTPREGSIDGYLHDGMTQQQRDELGRFEELSRNDQWVYHRLYVLFQPEFTWFGACKRIVINELEYTAYLETTLEQPRYHIWEWAWACQANRALNEAGLSVVIVKTPRETKQSKLGKILTGLIEMQTESNYRKIALTIHDFEITSMRKVKRYFETIHVAGDDDEEMTDAMSEDDESDEQESDEQESDEEESDEEEVEPSKDKDFDYEFLQPRFIHHELQALGVKAYQKRWPTNLLAHMDVDQAAMERFINKLRTDGSEDGMYSSSEIMR
jgi:hypothetical protein